MSDLRYAILRHHNIPEPHFDLLFETAPNSPLTAFRSDTWPITQPTLLIKLPDHRQLYLNYQGPISNDRGEVKQLETGLCQITQHSRAHWEITLLHTPPTKLLLHSHPDGTWHIQKAN